MGFSLSKWWQRLTRGPAVFVIEFDDAGVTVAEGRAPRTFIEDCEAIAREHGIRDGWVAASGNTGDAKLTFAGSIPGAIRQRLRNAWSFSTRR
jgi:hypothetical protein